MMAGRIGVAALIGLLAAGVFTVSVRQSSGADGRPATPRLATEMGAWWQYRGDQRLSGRSSLRGTIRRPAVVWSHPIAGRESLVAVALAPGAKEVRLPSRDERGANPPWSEIEREWSLAGPYGTSWLDLDGDERRTGVSRSYNEKVGKVLPDAPGLQRIQTEAKGYPNVPNVYKGTVRLSVRERGGWVTRWETETDTLIWQAEPIFGDFDGDGRNEIALLPWYRLTLLDAATGKLKEQCNYLAEDEHEIPGFGGRAYGWFGATDVDGDGQTEFVIIEDFIRYATVLGRRDGKLERRWLRVWQPRSRKGEFLDAEKTVVVRVNPEPVQDIDGDSVKEIVVSAFNLEGDSRWHVLILDARTGATRFDLPGQFLTGLRDANGDGISDLCCTAVDRGLRIPEPAELTIHTVKAGALVPIWTLSGAAFVTYGIGHFPSNVNSGAALGGETILCAPIAPGTPSLFFTRRAGRRPGRDVEVTCWQADAGSRFRRRATWTGPRLEPLMLRTADPPILMRCTTFDGEQAALLCRDGKSRATVQASRRVSAPISPVVVGRPAPGSPPILVVQGANETVEAFRPTRDGKTRRLWRVPGRGMTCNNTYEGLLLADLAGDGRLSVVVGTRGPGDCARLAALSARDGRTLWSRDFAEFPGTPPPWNVPGLMYWQGGYFRDPRRMDLLVQLRRVGGESLLLDGRSGETLWQQTKGRTGRDFGRAWMAMLDYDGDGREDVLNLYPDMFCVARGTDGRLLVAEESVRYVGIYAYYADMIAADYLGRGEPQVLYTHPFVTALLTARGERLWKVEHPHPDGWRTEAGFGDADGDGRREIFFPGATSSGARQFQCRDAATGALKWSLPMPDAPVTVPAVADIDGDGRDECVFTSGKTLYAVGAAKEGGTGGALLWTLDLPDRLGPVTIADTDGSGTAQIVVTCADGHIYGIGPGR
jgi:outer membrane protein assembly factor BamB